MTDDGRIVDTADYGRHIPLRCKNHPDLRWSTKNIAPIGIRSIFYVTRDVPECPCPAWDLEAVPAGEQDGKPADKL